MGEETLKASAIIGILSGICGAGGQALAVSPPPAETVAIQLNFAVASKPSENDWRRVCTSLSEGLTIRSGAWGFGLAASAVCSDVTGRLPTRHNNWIVYVNVGKHVAVELYRRPKTGSRSEDQKAGVIRLARIKLPIEGRNGLRFLSKRDISRQIALRLLDEGPGLMRLTARNTSAKKSKKGRISVQIDGEREKSAKRKGFPRPPKRLVLYTMGFDSAKKVWRPQYRGYAKLLPSKKSKKRLHKRRKASSAPRWEVHPRGSFDFLREPIYAHNLEGRKKLTKTLDKKLKKAAEAFQRDSSDVVGDDGDNGEPAAGYLGLRYGLSLLGGDLVRKTTVAGLVFEMRSGLLDGLRVMVDVWPHAKDQVLDHEATFAAHRVTLGYAFGLAAGPWITGVYGTPKVGVGSLDSTYPVEATTGGSVEKEVVALEFKVENALTLGLEIGAEAVSDWYLLSLWAEAARSVSSSESQATVTIARSGFDVFLEAHFSDERFSFSYLLFAFAESVVMDQSDRAAQEVEDLGEPGLGTVKYTAGYAGAGVALSW